MKIKQWMSCCKDIWHDEDGWWAALQPGYYWGTDNNTVFNGETWNELVQAAQEIHALG